MQIFSNYQTVGHNAVQDSRDFNSRSLATQAKKGEQLVSMMPAITKAFDLVGDGIVELSTENDALKNKIGPYDGKWFEETEAKLKFFNQFDGEKTSFLIMSIMQKQMKKQRINGLCIP